MKLSETKTDRYLSTLLIGYPGSGKSIAAASYPKPMYIFDLDRRINSLLNLFGNDPSIEYDHYGPDDYVALDAKIKQMRAGQLPYKTYVLDSLTTLARMAINYSIMLRGGGKGSVIKGVIQMQTIDDYNGESRVISQAMDAFRAKTLMANVVLTAHLIETNVKKTNDINSEEVVVQSLITGGKKIAAEVPVSFDEVYYISKSVDMMAKPIAVRYTSTHIATNGVNTKSALPIPTSIDFTMAKAGDAGLFQKIQNACKEKGIEIG